MYKIPKYNRSTLQSVEKVEGETIEIKVDRILNNKEPITDGAPEIYTEKKDGVQAAYNIRTDRWEVAVDAMDAIQKSEDAKREHKAREKEAKVIELEEAKKLAKQKEITEAIKKDLKSKNGEAE